MEFEWNQATEFAYDWQTLYISMLVGYVPTVLMLQLLMNFFNPLPLEVPLKLWNCTLSGLSLVGFGVLFYRLCQEGHS